MTEEIWRLGACETALAKREGKYSCLEVVQSAAARLSSVNPDLNAVTVDLTKEALDAAKEADLALSNGINPGPLYGVPITLKENIDLEGKATTLGVSHFLNNVAPGDAPVVRSLKEAGVIIIGQTNMPEFGLRWVTDNPLRGSTNNPWDPNVHLGDQVVGQPLQLPWVSAQLHTATTLGGLSVIQVIAADWQLSNQALAVFLTLTRPSEPPVL
jgi:amidase